MFLGMWKNEEGAQAHMNSDYFKNYVPQMGRIYEEFTVTELDKFL